MAAPRQPVQWRPTSPPRYRPLTVTSPSSGHHIAALPTPPSIPVPRGGLGPTPSPLASPAFGTPITGQGPTADQTPTSEQPPVVTEGLSLATEQLPVAVAPPTARPKARRGRHAAPVQRAEHAGARAALSVSVVALLAAAGVVLTWSDMNHTTPTAAAGVQIVEAPLHAVAAPRVPAPAPGAHRAAPVPG